jgi:putative signal transducing protein
VSTEQEAELVCGLLRSAGIECDRRATQFGESFGGGAQEVLVHAEDIEAAQALLPDEA